MRDIVLIFPENTKDTSWNLDIDIVDGEPRFVYEEDNTNDQRAAVAALLSKGSVPGNPNLGIDWSLLTTEGNSFLVVDNEIKQQIASLAGIGTDEKQVQYVPVYKQDDKGISVQVFRS